MNINKIQRFIISDYTRAKCHERESNKSSIRSIESIVTIEKV